MTPAAFLQNFPEFAETSPTLVNAKLQQAAAMMGGPDHTVWPAFALSGQPPTLSDVAHGNLAAHYLAISPFGTEMRLQVRKGEGDGVKTTYWTVWEDCAAAVTGGFVVSGQLSFPVSTITGSQIQTGNGTASMTNGSTAVVFSTVQTFPAGTVFVFYTQGGVFYQLESNMVGTTSGSLSAPFAGPSGTSLWGYQLP